MVNFKFYLPLFFILTCLIFISIGNFVLAQDTILPGGGSQQNCGNCVRGQYDATNAACKQYCGDYQLNDFMQIFVTVSKIILGLSGSLALLAFVAGGVMFLASAGNKSWVDRGRSTIIGAVIGLVIVFTSYMIIGLVFTVLNVPGQADSWFTSDWFQRN